MKDKKHVERINEGYECTDPMNTYVKKVAKELMNRFDEYDIVDLCKRLKEYSMGKDKMIAMKLAIEKILGEKNLIG